jgi:hypothetical protein
MSISRRNLLQASAAAAVFGGVEAALEVLAQPVDLSTSLRSWDYRDRFIPFDATVTIHDGLQSNSGGRFI